MKPVKLQTEIEALSNSRDSLRILDVTFTTSKIAFNGYGMSQVYNDRKEPMEAYCRQTRYI